MYYSALYREALKTREPTNNNLSINRQKLHVNDIYF